MAGSSSNCTSFASSRPEMISMIRFFVTLYSLCNTHSVSPLQRKTIPNCLGDRCLSPAGQWGVI